MAAYEYRIKGLQKVSAQVAGEVCEMLKSSDGGLTPSRLLDASRPDDAPLHNEFEWDDSKAAESYRKQQARSIISNIRIVLDEQDDAIPQRAFVVVNQRSEQYEPIRIVMQSPSMMQSLLKQAEKDMRSFQDKYKSLSELSSVLQPIGEYLQQVG